MTDLPARKYGPGGDPHTNRTLASFSAEATARFLGGGQLGDPAYLDPKIAEGLARQRRALRTALYDKVVPALVEATAADSAITSRLLAELANMAKKGDAKSGQLLGAMIGQLLTEGLNGGNA